jgi:hypothetical protein
LTKFGRKSGIFNTEQNTINKDIIEGFGNPTLGGPKSFCVGRIIAEQKLNVELLKRNSGIAQRN